MTFASLAVGTPIASTETFSYTPGTNRLAALSDAGGTRTIAYDGRGNTLGESRPGGGTVSTTYDGYGRLLSYVRSGDPAQANAYNGLDDRVTVSSDGIIHSFVNDPDGRLIGEYDNTGAPIAETIWLSPEVADNLPLGGSDGVGGYAPLAMVSGWGVNAVTYWIHGNHLGVPIAFTDATGTAVPPPSYTLPGFPGQLRTLADLYYNRHRDYDSSTGRYIQADPIGLAGGNSPYLYAEGNPIRYTDPFGLKSKEQIAAELTVKTVLPKLLLEAAAQPSRKIPLIGQALLVGDAIGTTIAVGKFLYDHCGDDDDCEEIYRQIKQARDVLARRRQDFKEDKLKLPASGPMSRAGHIQQFKNWQQRLRLLLAKAEGQGCFDYVRDAWAYATMPIVN